MTTPMMIRLDIEGMRYSIVHAFMQHNKEIESVLEEELKKKLEAFDISTCIENELRSCLHEIVKATMQRVVREAFDSPEIKSSLELAVTKEIKNWSDK